MTPDPQIRKTEVRHLPALLDIITSGEKYSDVQKYTIAHWVLAEEQFHSLGWVPYFPSTYCSRIPARSTKGARMLNNLLDFHYHQDGTHTEILLIWGISHC